LGNSEAYFTFNHKSLNKIHPSLGAKVFIDYIENLEAHHNETISEFKKFSDSSPKFSRKWSLPSVDYSIVQRSILISYVNLLLYIFSLDLHLNYFIIFSKNPQTLKISLKGFGFTKMVVTPEPLPQLFIF